MTLSSLKKSTLNGLNSRESTVRNMLNLNLKLTDCKSSLETSKSSRLIRLVPTVSLNSSINPLKNSPPLTSPSTTTPRPLKLLKMVLPLVILTGLPLTRLPPSRTKVNVVHAGLSLPLVLLNLLWSLVVRLPVPLISLNNNWSIVLLLIRTMVAMVV